MTKRSKAQRAAEARYEAKRHDIRMQVRMSAWQCEWLDARREPNESRPAALRRLARMPTRSNEDV